MLFNFFLFKSPVDAPVKPAPISVWIQVQDTSVCVHVGTGYITEVDIAKVRLYFSPQYQCN